jgi:hypothetical protein
MLAALDTNFWRRAFTAAFGDEPHPGPAYQYYADDYDERPVSSRGFHRADVESILALVSSGWPTRPGWRKGGPRSGMLLICRLQDGRYGLLEAIRGRVAADYFAVAYVTRSPITIARRLLEPGRLLLLERGKRVDVLDQEFQSILEDAQIQIEIWRQAVQDGLEPR